MENEISSTTPSSAFQQKICRTCLCRMYSSAVPIFSEKEYYKGLPMYRLLKEITNISLDANDSLPKNICLKCARKVKMSVSFKMIIDQAYKTLTCNLRKAEWAHFRKVSDSIPSDFGVVLDRICECMGEIIDEDENNDENNTNGVSIITAALLDKSVNTNEMDYWRANTDNVVEGGILNLEKISNLPEQKVVKKRSARRISTVKSNLNQPVMDKNANTLSAAKSQELSKTPIVPRTEDNDKLMNILSAKLQELMPSIDSIHIDHNATTSVNGDDNDLIEVIAILESNDEEQASETATKPTLNGKDFVEEFLKKRKPEKRTSKVDFGEPHLKNPQNLKVYSRKEKRNDYSDEIDETPIVLDDEDTMNKIEPQLETSINKQIDTITTKTNNIIFNDLGLNGDKPVACYKCNKKFTSSPILQRHLLYHSLNIIPTDTEKPKEDQLKQRSENPPIENLKEGKHEVVTVQEHIKSPSNHNFSESIREAIKKLENSVEKCEFCDEVVRWIDKKTHIHQHHRYQWIRHKREIRRARYKCPTCNKPNRNALSLKSHMKTHEEKFKCEHCDKRFTKRVLLKNHLHNTHACMSSICYVCGRSINVRSMEAHLRAHATTKSIKCTVEGCKTVLKYRGSLRHHLEHAHGTKNPHICEYCGKVYTAKRSLNVHIQASHSKLMHHCDKCESSFRRRNALRRHYRNIHLGEKSYKCPVCLQAFTYKDSLRGHCEKYHPGHPLAVKRKRTRNVLNKIYECNLCTKKFVYEHNLRKHNRISHPVAFLNRKILSQSDIAFEEPNDVCGEEIVDFVEEIYL